MISISTILWACADEGAETDSGSRTDVSDSARPTGNEAAGSELHQRMVRRLADLSDRTADENPWLGDRNVRRLQENLAELPQGAGKRSRRQRLLRRLGNELLRIGDFERAVARLEEAFEIAREDLTPDSEQWHTTAYDLAIAHLRWGEVRNCVAHHCCQSCILPLEAGAIHQDTAPSRRAAEVLDLLLEHHPDDHAARWLRTLAAMTLGLYPEGVEESRRIPEECFESDEDFPRFRDVSGELGLDRMDLSGGVVLEDFDADGDLDVLTSTFDSGRSLAFYRNRGPSGDEDRFVEETERANLSGILGGLNLVQGDFDGDGLVDVLVLRGAWLGQVGRHPNSLLRNLGDGRFVDATEAAGLLEPAYPTQTAAWADYDLDGDLDLYVGNEGRADLQWPNQLYRNDGDGTFTDVAHEAGVEDFRYTKAVVWGDFDADGHPDLYVSNLGDANRLYRNLGDGRFRDDAFALGVQGPRSSFPSWFWDFDDDGQLDLFVSAYYPSLDTWVGVLTGRITAADGHALYRNDGNGGFTNVGRDWGLTRREPPMGANFGDLDGDGRLDFYLGTGYPSYDGLMPNALYHNRGDRFADVTIPAGVGHLQKGHGIAFGDLDGDGDQDLFAQLGGAYPGDGFKNALFLNPGFGHHCLEVEVVGVRSNRSAIGARVTARFTDGAGPRTLHRWVGSGGSFGASSLRVVLGLGDATEVEQLEIQWPTPGGEPQVLSNVEAGRVIRVREGVDGYEEVAVHVPGD